MKLHRMYCIESLSATLVNVALLVIMCAAMVLAFWFPDVIKEWLVDLLKTK